VAEKRLRDLQKEEEISSKKSSKKNAELMEGGEHQVKNQQRRGRE